MGFFRTLETAATIKKLVYLPGDHDHTLWTGYHRRRHGEDNPHDITGPAGTCWSSGDDAAMRTMVRRSFYRSSLVILPVRAGEGSSKRGN